MPRRFTKAFLLAAGLGTRLRPLTDKVPKCLIPIDGKPLLNIWLEICERLDIREVLINTHHLPAQVRAWAGNQHSAVKVNLVHEDTLQGSAGTVVANRDFVRDVDDFWVFYADNLVDADLHSLQSFHCQHGGVLTLGLFRALKPRECGIVALDESGRVTSFEEKPTKPKSNLANAGIYIIRQAIFDTLSPGVFADFGKDVMPGLVGKMWGFVLGGYILDVGTPESYQKALEDWPVLSYGRGEDNLRSRRRPASDISK
jgi:mannose-1-phosphate guanylyltransferase